ncbi:MAG: hypothetical protein HKO92_03915 [Flavobacteriaceae bacterium]|nr:hypothetical protein [Flavobacteriaceae bacterium]
MKRLVIIISMFLALNINAKQQLSEGEYSALVSEFIELENEMFDLEQIIFADFTLTESLKVEDIKVIEIEEEVEINFDTKKYLPERFNAYKGMYDIDWSTVEIVEIEEDIDLNDTNSLPEINTKTNSKAVIVSRN